MQIGCRGNPPKMARGPSALLVAGVSGIRCFPYSPDRTRIGLINQDPDYTKIRVGLTDCAETLVNRFSDGASHGLCVPEGQLVSSGHIGAGNRASVLVLIDHV
jgi:hypothetical protein